MVEDLHLWRRRQYGDEGSVSSRQGSAWQRGGGAWPRSQAAIREYGRDGPAGKAFQWSRLVEMAAIRSRQAGRVSLKVTLKALLVVVVSSWKAVKGWMWL